MPVIKITKEVFLIGCLFLIVGSLFVYPPLAIKKYFEDHGNNFILAQLKTYRDEMYTYIPRAHEIYDGHFPPSDLFSDQQGPTPLNALPPLVFASAIVLFGGSITAAYLSLQFLLSGGIFILFYIVGRLFLKSKIWSVFFATMAVLTPIISNVFSFDFHNNLKVIFDFTFKQFIPIVRTQIDKLRLARIDYPLLVLPVYLIAIVTFVGFWMKPRYSRAVVAAIPAALLAYTYFHVWIYWTVVLGIMVVTTILFFRQDRELLKSWGLFFLVFGALLLPYFVNYMNFRSSPFAQDISYRYAVFSGHDFGFHKDNILDYSFYVITFFLVLWMYFRGFSVKSIRILNRYKKSFLFVAFIIAAVIVWNLQLFLGQSALPTKWRYPLSVTFYIIWASLLYDWVCSFKNSLKAKNMVKIGVVILTLLVFTKYTVNAISLWQHPNSETLLYYKFPNEVIDSWDWINSNLESEPKIISPSYVTSIYLTAYTSTRPFLPRGHMSLFSNFELENRLITARQLFGVPAGLFKQQLEEVVPLECSGFNCFPDTGINLSKTQFQLYGEGFKKNFAQYLGGENNLPKGKINELIERYNNNSTTVINNMPVDYVYYGPWEKQLGSRVNFIADKNLSLVYRNPSVEIYKVVKP